MDSVESIAAFSTAMSQAKLQSAVSMKVLKLAQNQQQVVADMLMESLESTAEIMNDAAGDANNGIDTYA